MPTTRDPPWISMSNATFPIINVLVVASPRGLSVSLPGANPFNMPSESGTESAALAADPRKQDDEWCQQWWLVATWRGSRIEKTWRKNSWAAWVFQLCKAARCVCFFFQGWLSSAEEQKPSTKEVHCVFSWFPMPFSSETCGLRIIMCSNKIDTRVDCPIYSKGTLPLLQMHLCIQDGSPMMQRYWNLQGFSWQ